MNAALDLSILDEQTFGDAALRREILVMFKEQAPALLAALAASYGPARADIAHRLKGSSLAIGAHALADAAAAIESDPLCEASNLHLDKMAQATLADIATLLAQ